MRKFSATVTSDDVSGKIANLTGALRNRILRKATLAATKPLYDAFRSNAPRDSGLLYRSAGRKVVTFRANAVSVGLVGPRRKFGQAVFVDAGRIVNGKPRKGNFRYRVPTRYSHLVERKMGFASNAMVISRNQSQEILRSVVESEVMALT